MEASILITVCEILLRSLKKACEWSINEESSDRWAKHHTNIQNLLDDLNNPNGSEYIKYGKELLAFTEANKGVIAKHNDNTRKLNKASATRSDVNKQQKN